MTHSLTWKRIAVLALTLLTLALLLIIRRPRRQAVRSAYPSSTRHSTLAAVARLEQPPA